MQAVPQGYVPYRVRELRTGDVAYFNFALAKEMGLLPHDHPHQMTAELKAKLIETFSIQIINEYDELMNRRVDPRTIKNNKYMASRYLQLQHANKRGTTSGDGRGIWNGVVEYRGKIWDVSSRGTGVTCLAPGSVEANRPLKTGSGAFGYGCGLAEIDELYGAAILAEIMHLQGIHTERVLCLIDLGKGYGIGVRAGQNLLRPAHLFMYLKQNRLAELKAGVDYLIQRQSKNGRWKLNKIGLGKYEELTQILSESFAKFTATLDIDYIFAWLDWDGDNVLTDAGIIDYGSVRQFGLRHDQYRYDDVERFSTNLNEQRTKAKLLVQVFAQMLDYVRTGQKRALKEFAKHPAVTSFNAHFDRAKKDRLLYRMGFNADQRERILKAKNQTIAQFQKEFEYFERAKISGSLSKVADGVNHPALFNMRNIFRHLPDQFLNEGFESSIGDAEFYKMILSSFAKTKDTQMRPKHQGHLQNFQRLYKEIFLQAFSNHKPTQAQLKGISERAKILNRDSRITGNALIQIVNELIAQKKKGLNHQAVQAIIDQFILNHLDFPEVKISSYYSRKPRSLTKPDLFSKLLTLVEEHQEDI